MKKVFINAMFFCAISAAVLSSCSTENDPTDPKDENELSGAITNTVTLDATKEYTLNGTVTVEDGGELVIPAGTTIKCKKGFSNYLIVLQGGKINAKGTAEKPITFTAEEESAKSGYWGGIIINGKAPISGEDGETAQGQTEVNNAYAYGGSEAADNSGILEYVKIEYAGARSTASVEHNGLTLNGVGSGTTIKNIYVLESADDAIEFFGGTVNVDGLLAVNPDDDMFDFTQGYKGTLSNCYGVWAEGYTSTEKDPRGIEADGNLDGEYPNHVNQSDFTVRGMTIDLKLSFDKNGTEGNFKHMIDVIKVRRGAKANITKSIVKGTGAYADLIDITDGSGSADLNSVIEIYDATTGNDRKVNKGDNQADGVKVLDSDADCGCDASIFGWTGYEI